MYFSGYCLRQAAISPSQASLSHRVTSGIRSSTARRASPAIAASGLTILLNSAASMSMWILVAPTQNSDSLPVMRSSQRAPMATMQSQFITVLLA